MGTMKIGFLMLAALAAQGAAMAAEYYSVPGGMPRYKYQNPELKEKLMFKDSAIYCYVHRGIPPENGPATWRTVRENYTSNLRKDDKKWADWNPMPEKKPGYPILAVCSSKRNVKSMSGAINLDMADYAAFTNSHPTVYAWSMFAEFDNDSRSLYWSDVGFGQAECCGYMTTHIPAGGVKIYELK